MRGDGIVAAASNGAPRRPRLTLLEAFDLSDGAEPVSLCLPVQRLLAFLALRGRPTRRAYVAFTLWTDSSEDRAFGSLRSALWRLRRDGHRLVEETNGRLRLAPAVRVDVHEAAEAAHRVLDPAREIDDADRDRVFLDGELLPDWYDDWVAARARALPPASRARTRTAVRAAHVGAQVHRSGRDRARRRRRRAAARERAPGSDPRAPRRGERGRGAAAVPDLPRAPARPPRARAVGTDGRARASARALSVRTLPR